MDNGCPKCEELSRAYYKEWGRNSIELCLIHQLEQAEADVLKAMNRVEELKKKIAKEQENVSADTSDIG